MEDFNALWEIDKHYLRKEDLLFPYLEKYGITAPPKVMWGVPEHCEKSVPVQSHLLCDIPSIESSEPLLKHIRSTASIATGIIDNMNPYQKTIPPY